MLPAPSVPSGADYRAIAGASAIRPAARPSPEKIRREVRSWYQPVRTLYDPVITYGRHRIIPPKRRLLAYAPPPAVRAREAR
jgi:hypothetical protein